MKQKALDAAASTWGSFQRIAAAPLQPRSGAGGGAAVHNIFYNSMYNMAAAVQRRSDT